MTFNAHLAQFDVAPTRTRAGISLIWDYLIIIIIRRRRRIIGIIIIIIIGIIIIINCKIYYVTLGGRSLRNVTKMTRTGEGSKNHEIRVMLFMDGSLETCTTRKLERKYLESFEMWCWCRMEKTKWESEKVAINTGIYQFSLSLRCSEHTMLPKVKLVWNLEAASELSKQRNRVHWVHPFNVKAKR